MGVVVSVMWIEPPTLKWVEAGGGSRWWWWCRRGRDVDRRDRRSETLPYRAMGWKGEQ